MAANTHERLARSKLTQKPETIHLLRYWRQCHRSRIMSLGCVTGDESQVLDDGDGAGIRDDEEDNRKTEDGRQADDREGLSDMVGADAEFSERRRVRESG
jgi:hypothetical protein